MRIAFIATLLGFVLAAPAVWAQTVRPPAVSPAPNPTDPFAAIKAGTQTSAQYQAQYRYMAAVDPADPFHNWGGNLWNQTWSGEWLAAQSKGRAASVSARQKQIDNRATLP